MSIGLRNLVLVFGISLAFFPSLAHSRSYSYIASTQTGFSVGSVRVSLRSGGHTLPCFVYGGNYYVLGQRGLRYSVWVQNQSQNRLEVVVSVDGRDVISGERDSSYQRRGYVLSPYRYVNITGFRTSKSHVASFRFTSVGQAYSTRMGDSWFRVGRIHVAVFHERNPIAYIPRPVRPPHPHWRYRDYRGYGKDRMDESTPSTGQSSGARKSAPNSAPKSGGAYDSSEPRSRVYRKYWIPRPTNRPDLGTAYGQSVYAPAQYTTFERLTTYPSHQLTLYYNNCEGFRRSGVCTRWCPCYRRWYRGPMIQDHEPKTPRFSPPPPQ